MSMNRKTISWITGIALVLLGGAYFVLSGPEASGSELPTVTVYKSPACGCCTGWVEHMEEAGFDVEVVEDANLQAVKAENGVPRGLWTCHTATVSGYTVEGHVPAADVKRLLAEEPAIAGIGVGGMPSGSPGMPGVPERYTVASFAADGSTAIYARH